MKKWLRMLGLGRVVYFAYHAPVGWCRDLIADGGPIERHRTERGRREMIVAAHGLPSLPNATGTALSVHLLTGSRYWYQTAFCLWTFARQCGRPIQPVILDDGSLEPAQADSLRRLFPATQILTHAALTERLDQFLPVARFPSLRARRKVFPLLRKLTDVHAGLSGWRLFIDSDLLFFHRPDFLINWIDQPIRPLRGEDVVTAYGYPLDVLAGLAGRPVAERINTGTLGLRSDDIDWERMEYWCKELLRLHTHYYQEQALVALLLAGQQCAVPPPADYVILPQLPEALDCRAVMHHYVANSKRYYFQRNWRHVLPA